MVIGRSKRRSERAQRVSALFDDGVAPQVLDLLELLEFAWHDCYGEITPPEAVIEDILVVSRGRLDLLISASRLAITDWRDLCLAADDLRKPS
jgi:hypothetical protein